MRKNNDCITIKKLESERFQYKIHMENVDFILTLALSVLVCD